MKRSLLLVLLIMSSAYTLNAQIFTQDFSSSNVVADYVSGTPDSGQFNDISASSSHVAVWINNGALRFNRTGTATMYAYRNFNFTSNPKFVQLKFDFELSNYQQGTQNPSIAVFIGSHFSSASFGSSSTYTSRIGIVGNNGTNEFKVSTVDNMGGALSTNNFSGKQTITFVVNNSGSDQTYTGPDGSIEAVASCKMDVWVGNSKGINDFSLKNTASPTADITGFKFQAAPASGLGLFDFDNIEMRDLIINIPGTPSTIK